MKDGPTLSYDIAITTAEKIFKAGGRSLIAYYLQGSAGHCPFCRSLVNWHSNDCKFAERARELLEEEEQS